MVTATRSETTKIVKRAYLLQWQVRNMLSRTTVIDQEYLENIDKGIQNQWFRSVKVHGFDTSNRCHCGVELEINWLTHAIEVVVWGETVSVNQTVWASDECCPEVVNAIAVFNQAVNAECLTTRWRVSYAEGVAVERIRRELGFVPAPPITWAGKVSTQSAKVAELPELTVRLLIAESDELVPETGRKPKPAESLFERIKQVLAEMPPTPTTRR